MNYLNQIERIKSKLVQAKITDKTFKVFGSNTHKYILNKPVRNDEVTSFEKKYAIQLPECYKSFILNIGNGGASFSNSGAGPFFGIYSFGDHLDNLIYDSPEKYLSNKCILKPNLTDDDWSEITKKLDDDTTSSEDFDIELGKIYSGVLPLGSQGCTYIHGLVLNSDYKGRVVNVDINFNKPSFAFEDNFLDWYERWLDEIISEELMDKNYNWFGYTMRGEEMELVKLFQSTDNIQTKKDVLIAIQTKKEISSETLKFVENEYSSTDESLKIELQQIIAKFT